MTRLSILICLILSHLVLQAQNSHSGIYISRKDTIIFNEIKGDFVSYFNTHNGRKGRLRKISDWDFVLGKLNKVPDSNSNNLEANIHFSQNFDEVFYKNNTGERVNYTKQKYIEKNLSIKVSDGTTLNAKLVMPAVSYKLPLIIVAHGSDFTASDGYKEPYLFSSWGVATIVTDKRGVGKSTGSTNSDIFTLADDLCEVAKYASNIPEIDSNKIGLWGFSQGGWISQLALIHQPLFHFALILSGPATTGFEEEVSGIEKSLKFYGYKEKEIKMASDLMSEIYLTVQHFENWKNLDSLKKKFQSKPWFPLMIKQSVVCSYFLGDKATYIKDHFNDLVKGNSYVSWCFYDPERYISRITQNVIWIYGTEDKSIPVERSINALNKIKNQNGNEFEIKLIKGINHAAYIDEHTGVEDYEQCKYISTEYLYTLKNWLMKQKIVKVN